MPEPTPSKRRPMMTGRMALSLAYDTLMAVLVMQFSIWFRYNFETDVGGIYGPFYLWQASLMYGGVAALAFIFVGLPRGIWRFTSFDDLIQILQAVTLSTLLFIPVLFLFTRLEFFPRSALFIHWPLLVAALSAPRVVSRLLRSGDVKALLRHDDPNRIPVLLLGPSEKMEPFIREAQQLGPKGFPYRIVGLIDPDPSETGHMIRSHQIIGDLTSLPTVVERLAGLNRAPQKLVLADPDMKGTAVAELFELCDTLGLGLARAPKVTDLLTGDATKPATIRPIDLRDLLGRPQKVLNRAAMRDLVRSKRVLITGAGGTIGSELTRQVAALAPAEIAILDYSEFNLYQIDLELHEAHPDLTLHQILADVRDTASIERVFETYRPEIVFHAAALKHVPIVEDNPAEGMLTNVLGTQNLVDACLTHNVDTMVMISTDKAVNPSNMMGASKRIAELYCQAQDVAQDATQFVTVRFGNVLGSTGSVVPLFQRQLANGGPLTVTHPDITRYFMTTREAVELVLQAATLHLDDHGTDGRIFVLDMGDPIAIKDLAERVIRLAGLRPGIDIEITYTGLRPGEKLHESLFHELEKLVPTQSDGILLAAPRVIDLEHLVPALTKLQNAARSNNQKAIDRIVRTLVPEFEGTERSYAASEKPAAPASPSPSEMQSLP